jgi:hypothetical protein
LANTKGSKWVHRLSHVDLENLRAVCALCGPVSIYHNEKHDITRCRIALRETERIKDERRRARGRKPPPRIERLLSRRRKYRRFLKDRCERCSLEPEKPVQLEGHHVNGDHDDNRQENIITLCCNCHRLVHYGFAV